MWTLPAALLAISTRRFGVIFSALTLPPFRPSSWAALFLPSSIVSSISPVAILATVTAAPITSAGRFSPLGPFGIPNPISDRNDAHLVKVVLVLR